AGSPNASAYSRQRERKSASSSTNSGVPNSSARSRTSSPATRTTPSCPRAQFRGHTAGCSRSSSSGPSGTGPAVLPGGTTSACRGPAGWARMATAPSNQPARSGLSSSHLFRCAYTQQPETVGEHLPRRLAQVQPGDRQRARLVVTGLQHPAGVVELVVGAGQVLQVA